MVTLTIYNYIDVLLPESVLILPLYARNYNFYNIVTFYALNLYFYDIFI